MKILIAEPIHPILKDKLQAAGFQTDDFPNTSETELIDHISEYEGLVVRSRFQMDTRKLQAAPKLKFVARAGSGIENIDSEYAREAGIAVINSPEGNAGAVGEHALGLLLGLLHKIPKSSSEVKAGKWIRRANSGDELSGKTIGIIGHGNTGSRFAHLLSGFDVRVLAYDKYKSGFAHGNTEESTPEAIFENADVLSFHVPLTQETRYMCNGNFINKFRKNFYLLNTSRGEVVNTAHVAEALQNGKILGAGLDVLEYEKHNFENLLSENENPVLTILQKNDNVIITPHIAGSSRQSVIKIASVLADKIIAKYGRL